MTDVSTTAEARSRRNVMLLAFAQALVMIGTSTMIAEAALVGHMLAENKALATLPMGLMQLAAMLTTFPASYLMKLKGRRFGFTVGASFGVAGQVVCVTAVLMGSFQMFCAGAMLNGVYNGVGLFYRFAAADGASGAWKSKAISYVLAGGVIAGIVGPELAKATHDLLAPVAFAGSFAALIVVAILAVLIVQYIDIPVPSGDERHGATRPLGELLTQPKAVVALIAGIVAYATMSLVMNATPLAMVACGLMFEDAARTIQAHVLAMFAPSFFTGALVNRFGLYRIMMAGAVLFAASAGVVLSGLTFWHFYVGLILLGLAWNFLYIGATTLLTETYRPSEKAKMQAANDFLVFGTVAATAAGAGALQHAFGWATINWLSLPFVILAFVAVAWLAARPKTGEA
ncbi:MAG: MFS transporter [Tagaea sp.]